MKKVLIIAGMAVLIASCGQKGEQKSEYAKKQPVSTPAAHTDKEVVMYTYTGILPGADTDGIRYELTLQTDGSDSISGYSLTTTYMENGEGKSYTDYGSILTLLGTPDDSTAVIYQLVSITPGQERINFLVEGGDSLTMIDKDFCKADSELNYTLHRNK